MPYQYKVLNDPREDELNDLGLDGWEIISVVIVGNSPNDVWPRAYMRLEIGVEAARRMKTPEVKVTDADWAEFLKLKRRPPVDW